MEINYQFNSHWENALKESQSDCSDLILFDHQLPKGNRKLSMYIKPCPTNNALLLQEARNRQISKTHCLLNKMLLSLSACLQFTVTCVSFYKFQKQLTGDVW